VTVSTLQRCGRTSQTDHRSPYVQREAGEARLDRVRPPYPPHSILDFKDFASFKRANCATCEKLHHTMPDALRDIIYALETALHRPDVRSSAERLDALLADDFFEIGASGTTYDKRRAVEDMPRLPPAEFAVRDFNVRALSDSMALATYEAEKVSGGRERVVSRRSSIWRLTDGRWRMVFHQGTIVASRS